ncbi:3-isopropylmalate dehydratase large subunit [Microbacteriaceae bacterium K1510]|nr:3-isopropylmalate dehydratase large subunit [Microbacteriaceae bacterium K1510]
MPKTLLDKIWDVHVVARRGDGRDLLYIDRHVVHELHGPHAFQKLDEKGRTVSRPDLTVGVQDHTVVTLPAKNRTSAHIETMRAGARKHGITLIDVDDPEQGIVHVVSPELGIALPGLTLACPDSHASTVGALGTLAFGCGTTELEHVLATQVMAVQKPKQMRVFFDGTLGHGVEAKDLALHLIRTIGIDGGRGYAVEYAGLVIEHMDIEARLTLCNMTIEWGARTAVIAPDANTFAWCANRRGAPEGDDWHAAMAWWTTLFSDADAVFDREVRISCDDIEPQITWGTDPEQVVAISENVPTLQQVLNPEKGRHSMQYMGLNPGQSLIGLPVHRVFIGSCSNSRLSDLRAAAKLARGRKVADGVKAIVVPGSSTVKRLAEAEGIAATFIDAGFEWRESGCSMCAGANGDIGVAGERVVSTTNRNFENRQGRGVRTHLASPATAVAVALTGHITDVRDLMKAQ